MMRLIVLSNRGEVVVVAVLGCSSFSSTSGHGDLNDDMRRAGTLT